MDPYVGEIRMFGGNFAPVGWLECDGQLLSISEYDVLFNLLGTTYGGDGVNAFALPDLRGRIPLHQPTAMGQVSGSENVTLTSVQIPAHTHGVRVIASDATATDPTNNLLANAVAPPRMYSLKTDGSPAPLAAGAVAPNAGGQPHSNMMPTLCVNFIISYAGIYPSQG
jgi:microcystin-dependent protein